MKRSDGWLFLGCCCFFFVIHLILKVHGKNMHFPLIPVTAVSAVLNLTIGRFKREGKQQQNIHSATPLN